MAVLPETIHVLLVDDEQLSRFVVGNLLRKCNYAVTVVDSGAQALEILSRSAPGTFQLILTDLMMPEIDGLDILRYVRTNTQLEDLPVIMMSANEQKDTVFQAIKGGAEEYLVKPVTKKEVQNIWQHVWKRVTAIQQQQQQTWSAQQQPRHQQQQPQQAQAPQLVQANGVVQAAGATATGTAATAAAGAAAAIHRGGSSRGVRHMQQQQKLLQQQHQQHQAQQWQQQVQQQTQPAAASSSQTPQQQELLRSMQQLHQAQQPAVFQPDRCGSNTLHSQLLLGKLQQQQQQLKPQQQEQQQGQSLPLHQQQRQQEGQPQQQSHQEDFESLAFFLSTLYGGRAAQAADIRASVTELDAQIAQVQSALQQLQPVTGQAAQAAAAATTVLSLSGASPPPGAAGAVECPGSAGSASCGETPAAAMHAGSIAATGAAATQPAAAAAAEVSSPVAAADASRAESKRAAADFDSEDDDDLEVERRERSRRHKRQRLVSSPAAGGCVAAAPAGQLELLRRASSTSSGVQLMADAAAAAAVAAAEAPQDVKGSGDIQAAAARAGVAADVYTKWERVSSKFDTLQTVYQQQKKAAPQQQPEPASAPAAGSIAAGGGGKGSSSSSRGLPEFLQGFGDDLWSYSRYSRLAVRGTVRAAADLLGGGSALVCAAAFDRDDEYVATAGVSKRIRIFEYDAITSGSCGAHGCTAAGRPAAAAHGSCSSLGGSEGSDGFGGNNNWGHGGLGKGAAAAAAQDGGVVYPVLELNSRSRLSCVAWSPYVKAQLASSDYEGVVQLWDANTGSELMQLEEHSKRAWAVDFSRLEPTRLVSSSDDGTVKLWSIHQEASVGTLQLHANVCSVQFSPDSPHLLAAGCANYRFYLYDLRNTAQPLVCVPGHRRPVSYVKWLDAQQIVTASTDNTLRRWNVAELPTAASSSSSATREISGAAAAAACRMTYRGHTNNRNFIGLAVLPGSPSAPGAASGSSSGGYIVCGSETNEAYAYHSSVPLPISSHSFQSLSQPWGFRQQKQGGRVSCSDLGALAGLADGAAAAGGKSDLFVSCVAWNRRQGTIVAANSAGHIQVLELA